MEIFLHTKTDLKVVEIDAAAKPSGLTGDAPVGVAVFLEDGETPLAEGLALVEQGVEDGAHVFAGPHLKVAATVKYNGVQRSESFSPSVRVKRVFDWACGKHAFDLGSTDKAEHTLAPCGNDEPVDMRKHVGEYADDNGDVCFDLAPKHRFAG
jgi:hypothetical protein